MEPFDLGLGAYDGHQYFKILWPHMRIEISIPHMQPFLSSTKNNDMILSVNFEFDSDFYFGAVTFHSARTIPHYHHPIPLSPPLYSVPKKNKHIFVGHVLHIYNLNFLIDWLVLKSHCSS